MDKEFLNRLSDLHKSGGNPLDALFGTSQTEEKNQPVLTTRGWFENWLYNHGIFEDKAKAITDVIVEKVNAKMEAEAAKTPNAVGYKITWDRPASEYPEAFYTTLILTQGIKKIVFDWAEENMPMAFWKVAFDPNFKMPESL